MKVGSLVKCVNNKGHHPYWIPAKLDTVYTVRDINVCPIMGTTGVYLEEIVNETNPYTGHEYGYLISRFRELVPPIDNIEEHIEENSLELQEL
jgi:hypothetical protein